MKETERDNSRFIKIDTSTSQKAGLIREWFKNDYLIRLTQIERYRYLGLETEDTRYALELEAYQKEFIEMQNWRSESKQIAKEILENF